MAGSIYKWFREEKNEKLVEELLKRIETKAPEKENKTTAMSGKTVVFTGTLAKMSRDEAKEILRKAGGNSSGSVSSKTDYVVLGENAGKKDDEAKKLGVAVISEDEFLALCQTKKD